MALLRSMRLVRFRDREPTFTGRPECKHLTHSRLSFGWFLCLAHTESMSVKLTTTVSP
jgi:hypothetical protein